MNRFILIDGNAILHRAFHALPPLTNKDGQMVNAVYGFFSMLLKIIGELKPCYIVVCFDRPKPTFRQTLYVGYQAHRPKMDSELVPQIGFVHKILEKAKISIFEIDGYEADDVIGTLSVQAVQSSVFSCQLSDKSKPVNQFIGNKNRKTDLPTDKNPKTDNRKPITEVIIVSGDRDMLQLVNSHVKVLAPVVGITKMVLFDEEKVLEKYGLKPSQIIDYKALRGDPSDGYPGVSGIGPKTASQLLKEFGNLESLYQCIDTIKQKNQNLALKLAEGAEAAGLAKKLATIVTDVPITLNLDSCSILNIDREGAKREFEKLGFKSLLKRLTESFEAKPEDPPAKKNKENEQLGFI